MNEEILKVTIKNAVKKALAKNEMNYSEACELLGFTTPKSLQAGAELAKEFLRSCTSSCPLRYKVAAKVLIDAASK